MKKEFLFNKIILLGCLLFSCMVMFSCDDDPEQTDREYMATGKPHPHLNQREIREAENFDIDGHHYEWIRYCKEGVGLRIIGLRTKEDTLVIPSHFLGYAVTKLGGTEKQIDISESYNGNNSNEFRGFANKIRMCFKKGGVETLVFHGKATKIKCIPLMGKSDLYSNFITAGRIIAPKGSAAIRTAKRSKKIGYLPPKLKKEILDGNSPNCYTDLEYMNVRLVPMEYSYL